jgi:methylmalonyl-CoA mutase C-terminal domain/subunit
MVQQRRIRVLLAKSGLDGHDRGIKVISQGLREEGMEVIYIGLRQPPEKIVNAALQEGVDVIGLSSLSGGHKSFFPEVVKLARDKGMNEVLIIGGGIIPEQDVKFLKEKGINCIFGPGTFIKEIADYIRNHIDLLRV